MLIPCRPIPPPGGGGVLAAGGGEKGLMGRGRCGLAAVGPRGLGCAIAAPNFEMGESVCGEAKRLSVAGPPGAAVPEPIGNEIRLSGFETWRGIAAPRLWARTWYSLKRSRSEFGSIS